MMTGAADNREIPIAKKDGRYFFALRKE